VLISFKHFASDDRDLYSTKVKHILENDITDMELTFSEEVYENGELIKVSLFISLAVIILLMVDCYNYLG